MATRQPPRPAPRGIAEEARTLLRQDGGTLADIGHPLGNKTSQESAPINWRQPMADAYQRPAGASRNEVPTYRTNNANTYATRCEMGDAIKKRPPLPCPCPDDIPIKKIKPWNFKKILGVSRDDSLLGVKDREEYCRVMRRKMNEVVRTTGPMQQRIRNRFLAERTWFELQSKLLLRPPVTNQRSIVEVLNRFEKKRYLMAHKERDIWKQDLTATVGLGAASAVSVHWGHAPRARLCACPDTPCCCTRTRAMPHDFHMPTGRAVKRVADEPSALPYVIDRLMTNVELDRRFYIKVAERGLMECIRPEVCLDECIPYFKVDQTKEAKEFDERCAKLTNDLREFCLDDDCEPVCDEMVEDEDTSESSSEDDLDYDVEPEIPCRSICSHGGPPSAATGATATPAAKGATGDVAKDTLLARIRTYFRGQQQPPPPRQNLLSRPKDNTGVSAARFASMGSLGSSRSESTDALAASSNNLRVGV